MAITSYRDLEVYQRAMKALVAVHQMALKFPEYERYALADQMRRASNSVPANIAEGYGRRKSVKIGKMLYRLIENWHPIPSKASQKPA